MTGMLARVLAEIRAAPPGTGLDAVARRVGLSRGEVDLAVDYWVRRGELAVGEVGCATTSCAATSCAGCPLRGPHRSGRGLITISPSQ
jgi:hypothetical protein